MNFNKPILAVGIVFLIGGVLLILQHLKKHKNNTEPVTARVSQYFIQEDRDPDGGSVYYYPIMEYNIAGKWYRKKSDSGSNRQEYAIGQEVEILYDPKNPESYMIAGDKSSLIFGIVGIALGAAICVLAFFAV